MLSSQLGAGEGAGARSRIMRCDFRPIISKGRTLEPLGVVGTGFMGRGIAQVAAQAGIPARMHDARPGGAISPADEVDDSHAGDRPGDCL